MNADLEERFSERRERFAALWSERAAGWATAFGLRVTLLPLAPVRVDDLACVSLPAEELKLRPNSALINKIDPCMGTGTTEKSRPGLVPRTIQIVDCDDTHYYQRLAHDDGLVEYLSVDNHSSVYPGNLMAVVGNALLAVEQFRGVSRKPEAKYGLEIEVGCNGNVVVIDYNHIPRSPTIGKLSERLKFTVGPRESFANLCGQIERRVWEVWGMRPHAIKGYIRIDFGLPKLALCGAHSG